LGVETKIMAKIYLSKLQKKYNLSGTNIRGINYRKLMSDIIENQSINISKATMRLSNQHYTDQINKLLKTKKIEKTIALPNIDQVLPKRSVFSRKAAIDGNLMTDTLRDRITKNMRAVLSEFKTKTGLPSYVKQSGKEIGKINPAVIKEFEKRIKLTFENYTMNNPVLGMPNNIHSIAVTEMRSVINPIKHNYNLRLAELNQDKIEMLKEWRQNKNLSKDPRPGHSAVNGKRVPISGKFIVPLIVKKKGKWVKLGENLMNFPHDPAGKPDQIIGCNCDVIYIMIIKRLPTT
jgi:hypothetical protein